MRDVLLVVNSRVVIISVVEAGEIPLMDVNIYDVSTRTDSLKSRNYSVM